MKIFINSVLIILVLTIVVWFVWYRNKLDFTNKSTLLFTAILIIITAIYTWQTQTMVQEMQKTNKINLRPYIMIKGSPVNFLAKQEIKNTGDLGIRANFESNESTFAFARAPGNLDYLYYSLKNLGAVPANGVKQTEITVHEINQITGEKRKLFTPDPSIAENIIFPQQEINRLVFLGKEIAFKNTEGLLLEINLKIKYRGTDTDENLYFTTTTLKAPLSSSMKGQLEIIDESEGIEIK